MSVSVSYYHRRDTANEIASSIIARSLSFFFRGPPTLRPTPRIRHPSRLRRPTSRPWTTTVPTFPTASAASTWRLACAKDSWLGLTEGDTCPDRVHLATCVRQGLVARVRQRHLRLSRLHRLGDFCAPWTCGWVPVYVPQSAACLRILRSQNP
jgi:hypothetical protein